MNEKRCRATVKERSGGCCEICGKGGVQMHHRKNRSQGGLWEPSNIMHLCVVCHNNVTLNPRTSDRLGWLVWRHETPTDKPVRMWAFKWALLSDDGTIEKVAA